MHSGAWWRRNWRRYGRQPQIIIKFASMLLGGSILASITDLIDNVWEEAKEGLTDIKIDASPSL
jgi:hypothetical protein